MNGILAHVFWKNSLSVKTGFIDSCLEGEVFTTTLDMEALPPNMKKNDIWQFALPVFYWNSNMAKYTFQHIYYSHMFIFRGEVVLIP